MEASVVYELVDSRIVEIAGDDARTWLQGQVTCDVSGLTRGASAYGLLVDTKGRIEADLFVVDRGESLWLVVPREAGDGVLARFDRFIVMDDVTVRSRDDLVLWTAQGASAVALTTDASWPASRLGNAGFDVAFEARDGEAIATWMERALELGADRPDESAIELARLRAGVPRFGVDFGPHTYPQEAGLERRAVSFTKGCYVGQETVVMIEHRGRPPRRLGRFELDRAERGEPVQDASGAAVGEVTSGAFDPERALTHALATVRRGSDEAPQALRIGGRPTRFCGWVGGDPIS